MNFHPHRWNFRPESAALSVEPDELPLVRVEVHAPAYRALTLSLPPVSVAGATVRTEAISTRRTDMTRSPAPGLTPHRTPLDLSPLDGITVLDEPLPLLWSALLRLQIEPSRDGMAEVSATVTSEEGSALERAMARVEDEDAEDVRSEGQWDGDRLVAVAHRVAQAVEDFWRTHSQVE
ncbi:hypothetical protein [Nocardioides lacusdianchii]|uniref:hypothetical protein n=1 Tax=Nocardioides lacusdianchii TaxID=2783664 RepID=UPI001CCC39C3|nr:hypothetical protein [Nocardioides lacusdianchii]